MFYAASKLLDWALAPLSWALLLAAGGALARLRGRGRLAGALGLLALAELAVFSTEPVGRALTRAAERDAVTTDRPGVTYDAVVVLGGMVDPASSRASGRAELNAAADRIVRGAEILRAGHARALLLSAGGDPARPGEPTEAELLRRLLVAAGAPPDRIVVEERSRNTRGNALETRRVAAAAGWRRLLLVTSAAHMPRALGCFRAVGLDPDALPVDRRGGDGRDERWLPRADALVLSTDALRELAGRIVYRALGWTAG